MSDGMKIKDDCVSATVLAEYLGLTPTRVTQLANDGTLSSYKNGARFRFNPRRAIPEYIAYIKKQSTGQGAEAEKKQADARLKTAQAEMAEMELAELRSEMHRADDVAFFTADLCAHIRSGVMSMPGQLAVKVARLTDKASIADLIERECARVLDEAAQYKYNPAKYRKAVRTRKGWKLEHAGEDSDDDEE